MAPPVLEILSVNRPFAGQDVSGDAWLHLTFDWGHRIALVDGAGHGPTAAVAAEAALQSLRDSGSSNFDQVFARCHQALLHTRGAVLSVVDIAESSLTFAGVGNVDGRLITQERSTRFTPDRGLLGSTLPKVRPLTIEVPAGEWFVVLHSDGFSTRVSLEWDRLRDIEGRQAYLEETLDTWGRTTDDATLLVVTRAAVA